MILALLLALRADAAPLFAVDRSLERERGLVRELADPAFLRGMRVQSARSVRLLKPSSVGWDWLAAQTELTLPLDSGLEVASSVERVEWTGTDSLTWVGRSGGSNVVLVTRGSVFSGWVFADGRNFLIRGMDSDNLLLIEVGNREPSDDVLRAPHARGGSSESRLAELSSAVAKAPDSWADDGGTIDVLIAYTKATPAALESYYMTNLDTEISQAMEQANTVLANSKANFRFRFVGKVEIDYTESSSVITDLSRLTSASDGYLDEVHSLRDSYGADIVSFWVAGQTGGEGGLANFVTPAFPAYSSAPSESAFHLVVAGLAVAYYVLPHEIGHNMGLDHYPEAAGSSRSEFSFSYAFGYRNPNSKFKDVIAGCPESCKTIPYFGNSALTYEGSALGVAEGKPGAADATRALNQMAFYVANFRQSTALGDAAGSGSEKSPVCFFLAINPTGLSREISLLRSWRDGVLSRSWSGRRLAAAYSRWAAPMARWVRARPAVRPALERIVRLGVSLLCRTGMVSC